MNKLTRSFLLAAATAATATTLMAQSTGPSSSNTPYLISTAPGWTATSILTVGDAISGYRFAGIPDGLGAFDNNDGTFTLLANHEIVNTLGIARGHGAIGAFVSKWIINKSNFTVTAGADLVNSPANQFMWNSTTLTWSAPATPYAISRLCAGDLPTLAAFWDGTNGYNGRIFMNGEEAGDEGKAFAWIVTGTDAGKVYELPHLGKFSWENAVARPTYGTSPSAANLAQTVVAGTDDSTPGQVYLYIGTKNATGTTAIAKAGLTNGQLYGIKVTNGGSNYANGAVAQESAGGINGIFQLAPLYTNATITTKTGANLQADSITAGVTQFARPEDNCWLDHDTLLFNTTGATVGGVAQSSKLYRLDFNSSAAAGILTTGGTVSVLVDGNNLIGTDGLQAQKFDNLTVGNDGLVYLQEDPGNVSYIAKHWVVNPNAGTQAQIEASAVQIFESDRARFMTGGSDFRTIDEEHSGIIDITAIVADGITGSKWFLVAAQNHATATGANAAELVEGGQFLALNYRNGSDSSVNATTNVMTLSNGARVVASGATISHTISLAGTGGVITTTGDTTISGQINGTGQLWKNGTGTLTLTNGTNAYGNTNVSEGKLVVNANLTSSVLVYKNATLGGSGRIIGNLTNYGRLTPGNSPGIVNITGNYVEAGILDIELWGTTVGTQFDQVFATGSATFQPGSTLTVTKTGGTFDPVRTNVFQVVRAASYSGSFSILDRSTQTSQVLFNNSTGLLYGTGLAEGQSFATYAGANANQAAIGAALYADGLVSATVIANGAGNTTSTAKAFLAANDLGSAVATLLTSTDATLALDALSPEAYGALAEMSGRTSLSLARAMFGTALATEGWTYQLGYNGDEATAKGSTTSVNGAYNASSTYVLASRAITKTSSFNILLSNEASTASASNFSSKLSGQTLGLGISNDINGARLDIGFTVGDYKANSIRNGQVATNHAVTGSTFAVRFALAPLQGFTPYLGFSRTLGSVDAFAETGAGANLNVTGFAQNHTLAEVGVNYGYELNKQVKLELGLAYEHNLEPAEVGVTAGFADAAAPTAFTVIANGFGRDAFKVNVGVAASLGEGRSFGASFESRSGSGLKTAQMLKANYTFKF